MSSTRFVRCSRARHWRSRLARGDPARHRRDDRAGARCDHARQRRDEGARARRDERKRARRDDRPRARRGADGRERYERDPTDDCASSLDGGPDDRDGRAGARYGRARARDGGARARDGRREDRDSRAGDPNDRARGRVMSVTAIDPRITSAANGDRVAAQALCRELLPRVRNLVRYLVRGDARVDDVAQEALIAVLKGLNTYRGEGKFESWVDRIVARSTFATLRRLRAETQPGAGENV